MCQIIQVEIAIALCSDSYSSVVCDIGDIWLSVVTCRFAEPCPRSGICYSFSEIRYPCSNLKVYLKVDHKGRTTSA